jgi:hypothetical protein
MLEKIGKNFITWTWLTWTTIIYYNPVVFITAKINIRTIAATEFWGQIID